MLLSLVQLTPLLDTSATSSPMRFSGWEPLARRLGVFEHVLENVGIVVLVSFGVFILLLAAMVLVRNRWLAAAVISGVLVVLTSIGFGSLSAEAVAGGGW